MQMPTYPDEVMSWAINQKRVQYRGVQQPHVRYVSYMIRYMYTDWTVAFIAMYERKTEKDLSQYLRVSG